MKTVIFFTLGSIKTQLSSSPYPASYIAFTLCVIIELLDKKMAAFILHFIPLFEKEMNSPEITF